MKKIFAILLSVLLILSLTACASTSDSNNASTSQPANENSAPENTPEQSEQPSEPSDSGSANAPSETTGEEPETTERKTLVVYYSASGNTENVANYIAAATGADLFKLEPVESYSDDDLNWRDDNSRVSREYYDPSMRVVPLTASTVENWDEYDTVFIGYPIWWGIAAWPIDGFIADNDFTGKTVIPFCTSSSSGLGESGKLLAEAAGTGDWQKGQRFQSRVSEEDVRTWVENLDM